jgi:cholesterol transport system auxiliary component
MRAMTSSSTLLVLMLGLGVGGCAFFSKGEVYTVRWFSPETARPRLTAAAVPAAEGGAITIGRVWAGAHLREKIAFRETPFEVGYYEDKRWTERPEVYVRRRIARTLFEEHGYRRSVDGDGMTLEVEVEAFEEVRGALPRARIQLLVLLHDGSRSLLEETLAVERSLSSSSPSSHVDELVQAMADALDAAAEEVASHVAAAAASAR